MINKEFIKRKISLIEDELAHLADLAPYSFDEIAGDYIKMAAAERFLERVVNRAIDINQHLITKYSVAGTPTPKDYTQTFTILSSFGVYPSDFGKEVSKSVGTRNTLVHEYDKTDQESIYGSIGDCLRDYHKYCSYVLEFLDKN